MGVQKGEAAASVIAFAPKKGTAGCYYGGG
jgi:hypothetical protein